ncbi:TPA: hypothetical protein OGN53_004857 [Escherichia coli]|nr:hypothetical protein [Salmonella enterica]HCQ0035978.1 hypothetical protein [Escherichia coli]
MKNSDRRDRVAWVVWSVSFDAMQEKEKQQRIEREKQRQTRSRGMGGMER